MKTVSVNARILIGLAAMMILFTGCRKDDPVPEPEKIKEATDVNKFIYNGLATYYYWEDNIPALNNSKYKVRDSLNAFLNKYTDPEELFESLLYKRGEVDKWSLIVDDSRIIDDWLAGISESMGIDIKLYYIRENSNELVGFIRYVFGNSPAEKAGLKRGDIFTTIDGQKLTDANYRELLFTKKTYTMGLATFTGSDFVSSGKSVTMTAVILQENPIHMDTILTVNDTKVGYLVYNSFSNAYDSLINTNYDLELNRIFGEFKDAGIQKLILDMRYNGGGYISSAVYLASMIHSADRFKIFAKYQFNKNLQDYYQKNYGSNYFNLYFTDNISKTERTAASQINSLGINSIYIITSSETASAPELLINGLKPYMDVIQVGENTAGKNVGSWTIRDYIGDTEEVNPNHTWAMQPITLKIANSQDYSDYTTGLKPVIQLKEYPLDMKPFADPEEPLLKACTDHIRGLKTAVVRKGKEFRSFKYSDEMKPMNGIMIGDAVGAPALLEP
jgi:C-terminal processing protease CtpA/Prc